MTICLFASFVSKHLIIVLYQFVRSKNACKVMLKERSLSNARAQLLLCCRNCGKIAC